MIHKSLLRSSSITRTIFLFFLLFALMLLCRAPSSSQNLQKEPYAPNPTPRFLSEYPLSPFLLTIAPYLEWSLILIVLATFSNSFSLLFPIILYLQSFFFMGFVTVEQGPLRYFYQELLSSKITLFAMIKLVFGVDTSYPDNGLPSNFRLAGVQMRLLHNIAPVFLIVAVLLLVTIVAVILNFILKSQKMRKFIITIKSIWNGLIYCLMPTVCFFMGVKGFFINFENTQNIIDVAIFAILGILIFVYFGFSIAQIKKHVSHPSIKQLKKSVSYINNLKNSLFKFDCLIYSIKYYYTQTYFKTIIFYFGVGITFGYPKIGVGILLFGELLEFIIFVTNPPFSKLRYNFASGLSYLSTMLHCFCLLIIDLNVVVQNHRAAIIFIYIFLSLHFVVMIFLLVNVLIDVGLSIHLMMKKKNIFDKKNVKINYDGEETNVKLEQGDKLSEETKPKSRDRHRDKSKRKRKDRNEKKDKQDSMSKLDAEGEKQNFNEKRKERKQRENQVFGNAPKIRKIKKPREI